MDSHQPRPRLSPLGAAVFVLVVCVVGFFAIQIWHLERHDAVARRMDVAILRLAEHRPAELSDDQWAYCVMCTWNLHGNYGRLPSYVPTDDLARIERELQKRIDNGVDLGTIDWIWDQYIEAYPRAGHYEHWRPTAPGNKESFDAGAHGGNPLSQWRADYRREAAELEDGG